MCRQTYHHYPSCGHIANWTTESCIEFTNSLRGLFMDQIASCPKTETTHDLLPLTHPTFCFQCEREWQKEFAQNSSLHNHPTLANRHMSIEGLGSTVPAVEVLAKSSLGLPVEKVIPQSQPVVHEVEADDRIDPRQDYISTNPSVNAGYRERTPPLPPPRLGRFYQQPKLRSMRRKSLPAPIITNPHSSFDPMTPSTSSGGSIQQTHTPSNPRLVQLWSESPVIKSHGLYNWIPVPTAEGPFSLPTASSAYLSPSTSYSALERGLESSDSVSSSPLLSSLPGPEEYIPIPMTPGNKCLVIDHEQPTADSFRNGLCIAFPYLFTSLWATSQEG